MAIYGYNTWSYDHVWAYYMVIVIAEPTRTPSSLGRSLSLTWLLVWLPFPSYPDNPRSIPIHGHMIMHYTHIWSCDPPPMSLPQTSIPTLTLTLSLTVPLEGGAI